MKIFKIPTLLLLLLLGMVAACEKKPGKITNPSWSSFEINDSFWPLGTAGGMYRDRYWHDNYFATVQKIQEIANEVGVALPTLAVAWVLANPQVTSPLLGASKPEQLDATLAAAHYVLDPEVKQRLDDLTAEYRRGDAPR